MLYLYSVKWCNAELCADIAVVFVIQNDSRVVNQEIHGQKFQLLQKKYTSVSQNVTQSPLVCQYVLTAHGNIVAPPTFSKVSYCPPLLHFLYAALLVVATTSSTRFNPVESNHRDGPTNHNYIQQGGNTFHKIIICLCVHV